MANLAAAGRSSRSLSARHRVWSTPLHVPSSLASTSSSLATAVVSAKQRLIGVPQQQHVASLNVVASSELRRFITSRAAASTFNPFASATTTSGVVVGARAATGAAPSSLPSSLPASIPYSIPSFPCTKSAMTRLFKQNTALGQDRSFFVNDVGVVERQYARWCKELPNVRPFYAVKCNPDETLLKVLTGCGAGFDVASSAEMESALGMGVHPDDIIFANPIKSVADLRYARRVGVKKMTFDNEAELLKVKEHFPEAELVMRLLPDDSGSVMRFGVKFGTPLPHIRPLLELSQRLNLRIIGTSFHIGSGCFDANSYAKAIELCRYVFDLAAGMGMTPFHFLDIGGGFPGNPVPQMTNGKVPSFETMASVIRASLAKHFSTGEFPHLQVIGEPGRYMATAWSTLFTYVQGKREEPVDPSNPSGARKFLYYVNDGVYGSFNCIMFDHAHPEPVPAFRFMSNQVSLSDASKKVMQQQQQSQQPLFHASNATSSSSNVEMLAYASARALHSSTGRDQNTLATFFGPTCDSMDCLVKEHPLEELFVGDWIAFENMGAYTNAAATTFNGMPKASASYCRSKQSSPFVSAVSASGV